MITVTVIPRPTISPARVEVIWEPAAQNLYCRIEYPTRDRTDQESTALRDMLDAQWPEPQPRRMIVAGQLSMVLDDEERLSNFDILANPTKGVLHPIATAANFVEPCVQTSFDDQGDARCPPLEEELYDAEHGIFCLSWGSAHRWLSIAPNLALGLASDGSLMKIQLTDFWISAPKPQAENAWKRLTRRLRLSGAGSC
mgnify:CR=1 FL=1